MFVQPLLYFEKFKNEDDSFNESHFISNFDDLQTCRDTFRKIKEERKEEKLRLEQEEKDKKEKKNQIFAYFSNIQSNMAKQNEIIDMYEEKILQNSSNEAINNYNNNK